MYDYNTRPITEEDVQAHVRDMKGGNATFKRAITMWHNHSSQWIEQLQAAHHEWANLNPNYTALVEYTDLCAMDDIIEATKKLRSLGWQVADARAYCYTYYQHMESRLAQARETDPELREKLRKLYVQQRERTDKLCDDNRMVYSLHRYAEKIRNGW